MMPPPIEIPDDEDYASSEDADFAPEGVAVKDDSSDSSDSDSETQTAEKKTEKRSKSKQAKRKRAADSNDGDLGFENSGDEGLTREGKKALKRRRKKGEDSDDGEGGLVKTRSQRALEKVEKNPLASIGAATVDVDALWANMISGNISKPTAEDSTVENAANIGVDGANTVKEPPVDDVTMITIKRTYNFAGQVHVEEKTIARDSAEARLWLESQSSDATQSSTAIQPKRKRPTKKLKRSMFEPILESIFPARADLHFGTNGAQGERLMKEALNAKKLNTVDKSKMDWAGFVDKEGIKDELVTAGKAKGSYIERQNFLSRVEMTRDEEARRARMTAK